MNINTFQIKKLALKFIKYGFVGCSGIIVDFTMTFVFIEYLNLDIFVSNALGFLIAATSNFYINSIWTFRNIKADIFPQLIKFVCFSCIGVLFNYILVNAFMRYAGVNFYASKFFAIGLVFIWNFSMNYLFTFNERKHLFKKNKSDEKLNSVPIVDVAK